MKHDKMSNKIHSTSENEMKISTCESIRRLNCSFCQKCDSEQSGFCSCTSEETRRAALRCTSPCKWRWDLEPNQHAICAPSHPPHRPSISQSLHTPAAALPFYNTVTQLCSSQRSPRPPNFCQMYFCLWTTTAPFVWTSGNVFQQRSDNASAIFTF